MLALQVKLKAKSKVEVVRRGLRLLREVTEREELRDPLRFSRLATGSTTLLSAEADHTVSSAFSDTPGGGLSWPTPSSPDSADLGIKLVLLKSLTIASKIWPAHHKVWIQNYSWFNVEIKNK